MSSRQAFLKALEQAPEQEKRGYLAVLERNPALLQTESCIDRFLRAEKHKVNGAVLKFLNYWDKRCETFGSRAFYPMNLTETSALSTASLGLLRTGQIAPLPPDASGRRVCYFDSTIQDSPVFSEDLLQPIFYVLQYLSQFESSLEDGISLLIVHSDKHSEWTMKGIKALQDVLHVVPLCVRRLDIVFKGDTSKDNLVFFESILPRALKTLLYAPSPDEERKHVLREHSHVHFERTKRKIAIKLLNMGFFLAHLPPSIGGTWTTKHHKMWFKDRSNHEREIKLSVPEFTFPKHSDGVTTRSVCNSSTEAIKSKDKRARRLCRVRALEIHTAFLKAQKRKLLDTNLVLEQAFLDAVRALTASGTCEISSATIPGNPSSLKRSSPTDGSSAFDRVVRPRVDTSSPIATSGFSTVATGSASASQPNSSTALLDSSSKRGVLGLPYVPVVGGITPGQPTGEGTKIHPYGISLTESLLKGYPPTVRLVQIPSDPRLSTHLPMAYSQSIPQQIPLSTTLGWPTLHHRPAFPSSLQLHRRLASFPSLTMRRERRDSELSTSSAQSTLSDIYFQSPPSMRHGSSQSEASLLPQSLPSEVLFKMAVQARQDEILSKIVVASSAQVPNGAFPPT